MKRTLIRGGPGAGKTTRLIKIVRDSLERGIAPNRIAFVAFARSDAEEARSVASKEFGIDPRDLPYFRTIHSLCFRELGLRKEDVLGDEHLSILSELTGEMINEAAPEADAPAAGLSADPLLTVDHYARTTKRSLHEAWSDHGSDLDWRRLERFSSAYSHFRTDSDIVDFTDMLINYAASDLPPAPVDVAIVDEAQDLTPLQVDVVFKAFANAQELYLAGDANQAVHHWAGADGGWLSRLEDFEIEVLPISHRLPKAIFDLSADILKRFDRPSPTIRQSTDRAGMINWANSAADVDMASGEWLLLARTRALLTPLIATARDQGVVYSVKGEPSVKPEHVRAIVAWEALRAGKRIEGAEAGIALRAAKFRLDFDEEREWTAAELKVDASVIWHDALTSIDISTREYYLTAMRRGEKINAPPRVKIDTIHGSKGKEADNVLLSTTMTYRTMRGFELDSEAEHRVFYVGATRARSQLACVLPNGRYGYAL